MKHWISCIGLVVVASSLACSISASLETLSDAASSPFEWSSASSESSGGGDSEYEQDVSEFTLAFVGSGDTVTRSAGDLDAFRRGLGQLGEERGVVDWEADPITCASIGAGLRRADYDLASALAFGRELLGEGSAGVDALHVGYASVR